MAENIFFVKTFIAGAGAAGLAAAISASSGKSEKTEAAAEAVGKPERSGCAGEAAESETEVLVADGNDKVGRKLASTGNGKCNFTNISACEDMYNMAEDGFVRSAFEKCGVRETLDFFGSIGIIARTDETGRCYPYSERASSVVNALYREALRKGCKFILSDRVVSIMRRRDGKFEAVLESGTRVVARNVIIACGGRAAFKTGSAGDGYGFAKGFGHTLSAPRPALTAVESDDECMSALKGVRAKGKVTLVEYELSGSGELGKIGERELGGISKLGERGEEELGKRREEEVGGTGEPGASEECGSLRAAYEESGEIQFTGTGLSGICVFDLTRYMSEARPAPKKKSAANRSEDAGNRVKYKIVCDFVPDMTEDELYDTMSRIEKKTGMKVRELLGGFVNEKLAEVIADKSEESIREAARNLKSFEVSANHTKGWNDAQTTCGGVRREEIESTTMESKLEKGLYFCGEVIDVDGRCGGFNLQWAWTSGMIAGLNAKKQL